MRSILLFFLHIYCRAYSSLSVDGYVFVCVDTQTPNWSLCFELLKGVINVDY